MYDDECGWADRVADRMIAGLQGDGIVWAILVVVAFAACVFVGAVVASPKW